THFRPATDEECRELAPGHWVVCEPKTGRTHQIRVHLAFLGAPVVGDGLYRGEADSQLWLHAWKLLLKHPVTGVDLELVADPERFKAGR
ncbi:MAG: pseudouridine synthase, partial [Holophaga sp.]|nr:pseudouridine synthase [Holophaga sp.]